MAEVSEFTAILKAASLLPPHRPAGHDGRRTERQRLAQFEELARLVIKHRAALGISQQELAAAGHEAPWRHLIKIDKVFGEEKHMTTPSPIGQSTRKAQRRRARKSAAYRAEQHRLAQFEELARLVIKHRAALGISQQELARRVGTSHSAISRLESGRHITSVQSLQRVAEALGARLVIGFESGPADRPVRELISARS